MSKIEAVRVWVFITVVGFVFAVAGMTLLRWLVARWAQRQPKPLTKFRRVMLVCACLGVLCMSYAHWIEPYWLEVTRIHLSSPKLATATRPIRLAHISDLHCDPVERVENKLIATLTQEKPDLIVFTGDTMNRADSLPVLKQTLTQLAAIAPTFVVKGNWDVWYYPTLDLFGGTGVKELNNEAVKFDVAGTSLWLVGAPSRICPNSIKHLRTCRRKPTKCCSITFLMKWLKPKNAVWICIALATRTAARSRCRSMARYLHSRSSTRNMNPAYFTKARHGCM